MGAARSPAIPQEDAERLVAEWFADAAGRAADHGWSRLHPAAQLLLYSGNRLAYESEVLSLTWGATDIRVGRSWWDGDWHVPVDIHEPWLWAEILGRGQIIRVTSVGDDTAHALVTIRVVHGRPTIFSG